ncbi:hypothetical protein Pelo_10851 [Pelomyxa schiedti]|nr:hypothetical protein Pelo_10851 [Pelomyxa schiedti]
MGSLYSSSAVVVTTNPDLVTFPIDQGTTWTTACSEVSVTVPDSCTSAPGSSGVYAVNPHGGDSLYHLHKYTLGTCVDTDIGSTTVATTELASIAWSWMASKLYMYSLETKTMFTLDTSTAAPTVVCSTTQVIDKIAASYIAGEFYGWIETSKTIVKITVPSCTVSTLWSGLALGTVSGMAGDPMNPDAL